MQFVCSFGAFDLILSFENNDKQFFDFFCIATAFVVTCMTTLISEYGKHDQKGTVLGIFRSIGALARALGPIFASIGNLII